MKLIQSGLIAYVRACTRTYHGYYTWNIGDPMVRSYYMSMARADWEIQSAFYRVLRRKVLGIV